MKTWIVDPEAVSDDSSSDRLHIAPFHGRG